MNEKLLSNKHLAAALTLALFYLGSFTGRENAFASDNACQRTRLTIEQLRQMNDDERANWDRLLSIDPLTALQQLGDVALPTLYRQTLAVTLTKEVTQQIIGLYETKKKSASRKLYRKLIRALNRLELDEFILRKIAYQSFVNPAFFYLLRKYRFAGKRRFANKMAAELRSAIDFDHWLNMSNRKGRISMFHSLSDRENFRAAVLQVGAALIGMALCYSAQQYFFTLASEVSKGKRRHEAERVIATGRGVVLRIHGHKAIGWGVYYDKTETEKALGSRYHTAKQTLLNAREFGASSEDLEIAEDKLVRILVEKLYGSFTHWLADDSKGLRYVAAASSEIIDNPAGGFGIDQQKALVLMTLLNDVGIESTLEGGRVNRAKGVEEHVWVRLKDRNIVVDPTWNFTGPAERYYDRYLDDPPVRIEPEFGNDMALSLGD